MKNEADRINLTALSNGSEKEFDLLFVAYYPKVKAFVRSMIGEEDESEDLAQETFIHLWRSREALGEVRNLNAYIYQITKHILYTYLEKRKRLFTVGLDEVSTPPSVDEVEDIVYSHELKSLLDRAIEGLPSQCRTVFCMSRRQGLSNEEISRRLGISKRTVETHISNALSILRKVASTLMCLLLV